MVRGLYALTLVATVAEQQACVAHVRAHVRDLAGHNLACWCPLPAPGEPDTCHAAVLLELANGPNNVVRVVEVE